MGSGKHLFVLIHGLWGNHKHMKSLNKAFEEAFGQDKNCVFFAPTQNALFKTFDGIEIVGYRTVIEICQYIKEFKDGQITKISIVGYSMGGLIARFVVGKMFSEFGQIFGGMEPQLFLTMASPHLGVQFYNPNASKFKRVFQPILRGVGSNILGKTGRELFITNRHNDILVKLAQGEFLESLAKFKWRVAFANVKNDRTVSFYTSYISDCDPFIATENNIKYSFEEKIPGSGYSRVPPRIIDIDRLDILVQRPEVHKPRYYFKWIKILPLIFLFICFVLPVMFCLNLSASIYSTLMTKKYRVMLRNGEGSRINYRKLGFDDTLKEYFSDIYGPVLNGEEEDDEENETTKDSNDLTEEEVQQHMSWREFIEKYSANWKTEKQFPKLPFDDNRKTITNNLNTLSWIKVPVYIKSTNAHGGIVARRGLDANAPSTSVGCVEFAANLVKHLLNTSD